MTPKLVKSIKLLRSLLASIDKESLECRVTFHNECKQIISERSPFKDEPVDCIIWVKNSDVYANDYNPNTVAPPEMELLIHSVSADGYTQPIVAWRTNDLYEVVDGFHRYRVGRECPDVTKRLHGYIPIVVINGARGDKGDRIASTIRHNRARGKHRIGAMSDIVVELKRRNWSDEKIGRELGMDADEVLRLSQISGLSEMFAERDFSEAWAADSIDETDSLETNDADEPHLSSL